jgi:hypothetical protein
MIGPRITDTDFFQKIDPTRPGLEGIPAAVTAGDFALARKLFAAEVRASLQPERFFKIEREFRGSHFMKEGETALQAAERIVQGELISCSTPFQFVGEVDWFSNPTFNQYKEWTWQLSRHPEWAILGECYRQSGDERYAKSFVDYFKSWVRQAFVPENADGGDTLCWRTIEAGIRIGGPWQWALHSFYRSPHFTDDVLVDWYKSVWEHGWRLRNFHRTGNWLIMEMNGLAQIGILYPQFKESPAWKVYAFDRLVEELDAQIYPDGWQIELSTGYHQVDIHNYQWLIDVCLAYAEPLPPAFQVVMEKMHAVNVLMRMPDGRLPDLNDGGWHAVASLLKSAVVDYPARLDFLWAATNGAQGRPPRVTSIAFADAGYYISRSGWAPDAFWLLLDAGHFGYGHQHEDKLNLLLHAYGRLLLTEGGNYAYDDSEMRRYVLSTRAHNTIRVAGQDQNRRINYRRETFDVHQPSDGRLDLSADMDVLAGVYDEGYGTLADLKVRHERRILAFKRGLDALGPFAVVIDRLTPADTEPHQVQLLWHFNTDTATVNAGMICSSDVEQPNLAVVPAQEAGLALRVITGQAEPEWQGWKSIKNCQQGEFTPTPTAVCEGVIVGPTRLVTLLYPVPADSPCLVSGVAAARAVDAVKIEIQLINGEIRVVDERDPALP